MMHLLEDGWWWAGMLWRAYKAQDLGHVDAALLGAHGMHRMVHQLL